MTPTHIIFVVPSGCPSEAINGNRILEVLYIDGTDYVWIEGNKNVVHAKMSPWTDTLWPNAKWGWAWRLDRDEEMIEVLLKDWHAKMVEMARWLDSSWSR